MSTTTTPTAPGEPQQAQPKRKFRIDIRQYGIILALAIIVSLFEILTGGKLLFPLNVNNLIQQNSYVLILAIGMVIVIIAGHIDLSVGSVVALVGAVAATVVIKQGMPWYVGVLAALVVGALVGMWQGFWVAFVGIPAFIVTLAGMLIFRGATMVTLGNTQISPFPDAFRNIASGYVNGWLGGSGVDVFTLVLGAVGVASFAVSQLRSRRARIAYQQVVESIPMFVGRI